MLGRRKGSARCFKRGSRKHWTSSGSLKPRFSRHCASRKPIFDSCARKLAAAGCAAARDQRYFMESMASCALEAASRAYSLRAVKIETSMETNMMPATTPRDKVVEILYEV